VTDVVPASGGGRLVLPAPDAIARAIEDVLGDAHARTSAADVGETLRGRLSPESAAQTFDAIYAAAVRRGAP
jgi:hypothetical protein